MMKNRLNLITLLTFSLMAFAAIQIKPTTTLKAIKADTVSRGVHHLMYSGFTGKVLVAYAPTKYTRRDLAEIASFGFDGVVVSPRFAPLVMQDAPKGLEVLGEGPDDPDLHIAVPADPGLCGYNYWKAYWHTRHAVYFEKRNAAAIEVDTWSRVKQGIGNCSNLTAQVLQSSFQFDDGRAPIPTIDHYELYLSTDGVKFQKLLDLSSTATSQNLHGLALLNGTYYLLVKAVALPLYRNAVSNEVVYVERH